MSPPSFVRRIVGASLLLALASVGTAQQPPEVKPADTKPAAKILAAPQAPQQSQEQLRELRAHKLAKPVFENAAWRTDFDAAKAEAKQKAQLLLVYFTRSYAH